MSEFIRIASGIDVSAVLTQLDGQPGLWAANPQRLSGPHRETSDIWVRYRDLAELTGPESFREPHFSVWYPAWRALPALRPIVFGLCATVESVHLGGILVTRMPPGATVYPHDDRGTWHSEWHNMKLWMPLRANDVCVNTCEDESVVMKPGEAWTFSNLKTHSVENRGDSERICLIVCCRSEP
jgi:hypothetical protein